MLVKITSVAESAKGKVYGNDLLGRTYFPKAGIELNEGDYAYVIKTMQTKTRDEDGNLIDLPNPVEINQITATWKVKADAIGALAELQLLGAEVAAEVNLQAKELKLSDAQVAALSAAW